MQPETQSPASAGRFTELQGLLRGVAGDEARYLMYGDRHDPVYLPWMPFQWADFIALLAECVPEAEGPLFCDIGSGTGTKMRIAAGLFGLTPFGVERDFGLAVSGEASARAWPGGGAGAGGDVLVEDALDLPGAYWGQFDIVWMYRPFRDPARQGRLEQRVYGGMRRGAIFAGGALEAFPWGWRTVVDDYDMRRGAWKKP